MNVYILLDRTGSMSTLGDEPINSINEYVSKLKPKTKVHLACFDSNGYDVLRDTVAGDWKPVGQNEASPRGMTNLYDACGKIMTTAEKTNGKKSVLVVMTDGFENCSKEYTKDAIAAKIKDFENRKWEVVFLGANFDAVDSVSGSLGLSGNKSMNYTKGNFARGMDFLASSTMAYSTGTAMNFTDSIKKEVGKTNA